MKFKHNHLLITFIVVFFSFYQPSNAQSGNELEENKHLTATILHSDSLFWKSYNECNIDENARFFTADILFYHDKGGVSKGQEALKDALKKNICGSSNQKVRREPLAGTVTVFPMRNGNKIYGAILSGEHYFYVSQDGKPEKREGLANFTHLWLLENNEWRMSYVLSYNHRPAPFATTRKELVLPATTLKQFEGRYSSKAFGSFLIKSNGNYMEMEGAGSKMSLFPETSSSFFCKERDLQFEFISDSGHKVSKMIVYEQGKAVDELLKR
jgi:hypothetical protein